MRRAPAFWERRSAAATLLRPAAALYGAVAAARLGRTGTRAPVPVICVGNFTLGGAGKTPTALALAGHLQGAPFGERPAFLTRGYGGRLAGPLRVDPARHGAVDVGDEPLLLARSAPTIVARDRPAGARLCADLGASVILMDDGLQNPSLVKDIAVAVVDGEAGIGNGLCLPAGPLRAPLASQWPHVAALVVVGEGRAGEALAREAAQREKPVVRALLTPDPGAAARVKGRRVLAFAGIGRPDKFFATLAACGARLERRVAFPDHCAYGADEIGRLAAEAAAEGLDLVTTEKDLVRIEGLADVGAPLPLALPVSLGFASEADADIVTGLFASCLRARS